MTEPIRLWAITVGGSSRRLALDYGNPTCHVDKRVIDECVDYRRRMYPLDTPVSAVELTEVRRCVTCTNHDSDNKNPGWCRLLGFSVPKHGHCHMHKEKTDA